MLIHSYRIVFSRLMAASLHTQTSYITDHFAEILDIGKQDLMRTVKPIYDADRTTWASWKANIRQWNDLQASNAKLKRSSKILSAGNALADVGAELFRVGRNEEASKFCEFGEIVWSWSMEAFEEEERLKGLGYWSDSADSSVEVKY